MAHVFEFVMITCFGHIILQYMYVEYAYDHCTGALVTN